MILAIDPGNEESAYCYIDEETYKPCKFGKVSNKEVSRVICFGPPYDNAVIEMVASYGMPVGREVFETCVWIGRFTQRILCDSGIEPDYIYRMDEKMNLCHSAKARDNNIVQALIDRFAPGVPNKGKGTKKNPGWFYGFKADIWQAYAVGVTYLDRRKECERVNH